MRRRLVSALLAAASAAAALPLIAWSAPDGAEYPDLRADAPERPLLDNRGDRLLLRFDGFVTNVGDGPLDVEGNPRDGRMHQRVRVAGSLVDHRPVPVVYETADGHDHWHLMRVMRYSLRAGPGGSSPEVAPGQKVGFCLVDGEAAAAADSRESPVYSTSAPFNRGFCGVGLTELTSLRMGVSVGWRDVYDRDLSFQWVDVSRTAPGTYWLAAEADPEDIIDEGDEANGVAVRAQAVTVPGHLATPVGPVGVAPGAPALVTLATRTVGAPGARSFRITRAPANGVLDVEVGRPFAGPTVTYAPRPGFAGSDSFEFAAVSTSGPTAGFPHDPPPATATLEVGPAAPTASVAISGAPAAVVAGTAVRLQAVVSGAAQGVRWTASAGTVDASGLFTAPAAVPPGGTVTVRAASTAAPGAAAEVVLAIVPAPVPVAAPGRAGVTALRRSLTLTRSGRILVVRVTPPRLGRLAMVAVRGRAPLASCVRPAARARRTACALRLPARVTGLPVRVIVRLRSGAGDWGARAVSRR
jgi:hypothetical protein